MAEQIGRRKRRVEIWIGGGLAGTLDKLKQGLRDRESLLLIGEPYWIEEPPHDALRAISGRNRAAFASLDDTRERIEAAGLELIEMVLADHHGWDRYVAPQWRAVSDWLRANADSADADKLRQWIAEANAIICSISGAILAGVFSSRACCKPRRG